MLFEGRIETTMQRKEFREDGFEGGVGFHDIGVSQNKMLLVPEAFYYV